MATVEGLKIAILVEDGFEEVELVKPREALDEAGAETFVVSPKDDRVRAWDFTEWSGYYEVDVAVDQAEADDLDALLLPGGVINPDKLRMQPQAVAFVQAFFAAGKPVASICHGPWTVIEPARRAAAARRRGLPRADRRFRGRHVVVPDRAVRAFRRSDVRPAGLMREALGGVPVRRIMSVNPITVPSGITIARLIDDYIYRRHHICSRWSTRVA